MNPLILLAAGAALFWTMRRSTASPHAPVLGQITLYKGVPYRMTVRLQTGSGRPDVVAAVQDNVRKKLAASGTSSAPTFMAIDTPPVWLAAGAMGWGRLLAIFDTTPKATDTTSIGATLTELGTIETVSRLDGKGISDAP